MAVRAPLSNIAGVISETPPGDVLNPLAWTVVASNVTLGINTRNAIDTTAARSLALPALAGLTLGASIELADVFGQAATNTVTVTPSGSDQINGSAQNLTITGNWQSVKLIVYSATTWRTAF